MLHLLLLFFSFFCFCFKWLVQVINLNLLKKNRRCKVIHNEIQRKFLLQNFCLGLLSYSILHYILHFSVHETFFTFMNARIFSLKNKAIYLVQCCTYFSFPKYSSHPSETLKIFYTQEAWKKDTMKTNLI